MALSGDHISVKLDDSGGTLRTFDVYHAISDITAAEHDGLIDAYINETTYWRDIPLQVWEYTLGACQVLKKWLSYRETDVLGRPLKAEEARTFMQISRRIAALLALNDALDLNYRGIS